MKKKVLLVFLFIILILLAFNYQLVNYGLSQGYGQLSIILNTKPVSEVMNDISYPDSLKKKIALIQEIKQYAVDSLGIKPSENYSTFYDQQGKPILWMLTASEPYELKAREWSFPVIGTFSYKGFFDLDKGKKELELLKEKGFDTSLDEVSAWSTLGWFKDPILSSMLNRGPGSLANLIIHELTHGTLYVKDNVNYNENLASFVGDIGAKKFLQHKYGINSKEYEQYVSSLDRTKAYAQKVFEAGLKVDSLYKSFSAATTDLEKAREKDSVLSQVKSDLEKYIFALRNNNPKYKRDLGKINNTYFLDFKRYRAQQNIFAEEFKTRFHSDFPAYFKYLKEKYPSM